MASSDYVERIERILEQFFKILIDRRVNIMPNKTKDHVAIYKYLLMINQQQIDNLFPLTNQFGPKIAFEHYVDQLKKQYIITRREYPRLLPDLGITVTTRCGCFSDNLTDRLENLNFGQNESE